MFVEDINPVWDEEKERIIGNEFNSFDIRTKIGCLLPYKWWRQDDENHKVIGYGWLIHGCEHVEISLSIAEDHRQKGLSKLILCFLEKQILNDNFTRDVIAIISSNNIYKNRLIKTLKKCGYDTRSFPIDDAVRILDRGCDVTFYKTL